MGKTLCHDFKPLQVRLPAKITGKSFPIVGMWYDETTTAEEEKTMNQIFKRAISLLLAILVISAIPQTGFAWYNDTELCFDWMYGNLDGNIQIPFTSASASSTLTQGNLTFSAKNAAKNNHYPWVEGVKGNGIGETLTLYFDRPQCIGGLTFRLGYQVDQRRYEMNNRPSQLLISFSDGSYLFSDFADYNGEQSIIIPDLVYTSYVQITIMGVYSGYQCDDTCIYQVKAYEMCG